ncbi:MAG: outer membrane autotransporter protein [Gammaproteobacteria bacterium]|jgi:outer membrane autotransporter protein
MRVQCFFWFFLLGCSSAMAAAQELVINGSFELGTSPSDVTGWTLESTDPGGGDFERLQITDFHSQGTCCGQSDNPDFVAEGNYALMSNQSIGSSQAAYQDILIPAEAVSAVFTGQFSIPFFASFGPGDIFLVDIQDTAGAPLTPGDQVLVSVVNLDGTAGNQGVTPFTSDLIAYAGQTIRLRFFVTADSYPVTSTLDLISLLIAFAAPTSLSVPSGLSPNATAVAAVVNDLLANDPELLSAFLALGSTEELNAALESLAPDMSGAIQNATITAHNFSIDTIVKRLLSLRTAGRGMMTGMAAGDAFSQGGVGMWLQGFGSTIDQDNRKGINGFDADTVGTSFGVDTLLRDNLRVGAAFSYASTEVDTNDSNNNVDIDSYQGALYASYESGPWFVDGIASYAQNDYDSTRNVVAGTVNRIAKADFDADQFGIKGTVGRTFNVYNVDLTPYVALHYVYLDTDGYTESGAGTVNLTVDDEEADFLQSTLGVSLSKEMETNNGTKYTPEAHIAWLHEYLDENQNNTSTFTGGGGSFTTNGFDPADDSVNIGASVAIYNNNNIDVRAAYDFEAKSDYDSHTGQLTLRYNF